MEGCRVYPEAAKIGNKKGKTNHFKDARNVHD